MPCHLIATEAKAKVIVVQDAEYFCRMFTESLNPPSKKLIINPDTLNSG